MIENGFTKVTDQYASALPALMRKVYTWMTLAMVITALTAYGVASSPNLAYTIIGNRLLFFGLMAAELGLVIWLTSRLAKLSLQTATLLFILYSVINGATLSVILFAYSATAIAQAFLTCALTFGAMSVYGYTTRRDLSRIGALLFMALLGLIIATVVNIFLHSTGLAVVLNYVGVLVFVGLTAWDTQNIKHMLAAAPEADEQAQKLALIGALSLYLDFINLFLYLLRLFDKK